MKGYTRRLKLIFDVMTVKAEVFSRSDARYINKLGGLGGLDET